MEKSVGAVVGVGLVQRLHVGSAVVIGGSGGEEVTIRVLRITPTRVHLAIKCGVKVRVTRIASDAISQVVINKRVRGGVADSKGGRAI